MPRKFIVAGAIAALLAGPAAAQSLNIPTDPERRVSPEQAERDRNIEMQ